ncbi:MULTISPECIES: IS200/IS605 family transposase, partial [Streptococcus]
MAQKAHSLSHTKWLCKYHIVFTPKYRRKIIYNQYRSSLGEIFRRLCSYKGVEIIEGHL